MPKNIVSFSGGKDSTAMLLMMLERKEQIGDVVFFDTGWEFPQMYEHIERVEKNTGIKIWRLHPRLPFDYLLSKKPIAKRGEKEPYRYGYGWPSAMRRWCTALKVDTLRYFQGKNGCTSCIGIAFDEIKRIRDNEGHEIKRYPLVEWGVTEKDALSYCLERGYDWGGLYDVFNRVSCFCCPLHRIGELKKLRKHFPELWGLLLEKERTFRKDSPGFKFRQDKSAFDLDERFSKEENQPELFKQEQEGQ